MTTTKEESAQRIGTYVNGKWRLDALIGFSSVAATYRAAHRNGIECALKIIHRSQTDSDKMIERFLQEAHLANRIDHPGVEKIFDDGITEDGCVFLVMELLEGETLELRRMASGGSLRLLEARPIFDDLLDILIAIHAAGVIHRNLKPANIFLAKDRRTILTDFGRARLSDIDPNQQSSLDGLVTGTPAYMPPEQARGRRMEIDERSDIWSAGAILFTLLSGRRVHEAKTTAEKLTLAQSKPGAADHVDCPRHRSPARARHRPRAQVREEGPLAIRERDAEGVLARDRSRRRDAAEGPGPGRAHAPDAGHAGGRLAADHAAGRAEASTSRSARAAGLAAIRPCVPRRALRAIRRSDPAAPGATRASAPAAPGATPASVPAAPGAIRASAPSRRAFAPRRIRASCRPRSCGRAGPTRRSSSRLRLPRATARSAVNLRASMADAQETADRDLYLPPVVSAFETQVAPPPPKPPSKVRLYIAIVIALIFVAVAATLVGIMYGVEEKKPPPVIELQ